LNWPSAPVTDKAFDSNASVAALDAAGPTSSSPRIHAAQRLSPSAGSLQTAPSRRKVLRQAQRVSRRIAIRAHQSSVITPLHRLTDRHANFGHKRHRSFSDRSGNDDALKSRAASWKITQEGIRTMAVDIAFFAYDYAYKLMTNSVKQEYDNQITIWTQQINSLLKSAREAYKKQDNFIQDIRKQQAADSEMAMMALSLVAGPALSWLGGTIQYKIFPRYAGKLKVSANRVGGEPRPRATLPKPFGPHPPAPKYEMGQLVYTVDRLSHNKVAAKVFADIGSKFSEKLLVNPALKAVTADDRELNLKIAAIGDSMLIETFETNVKNALEEGRKLGQTMISNFAGRILEDREYGNRWVAKLDREQPSLKDAGLREDAMRRMLHDAIDAQRREWAASEGWFYFANTPAPFNDIMATNAMEAEIWRLWILGEDVTGKTATIEKQNFYWTEGRSRIPIDRVLDRLVDLGVFAGRSEFEMNKIFERIENANNRLPPGPNPPKLQPLSAMKPLDPEALAAQQEELRKPANLLPMELSEVEGNVDTPEEFESVLEWATTRRAHALGGKLAAVPRAINPIDPTNLMQ
jgi:hypothetical protein